MASDSFIPVGADIRQTDADAIMNAAERLRSGGLVAFATETVYGLGADATDGRAVARIYEAKGRPRFNPLIVHVSTLAVAEKFGVFDAVTRTLAERFWPGPLTLVVPLRAGTGLSSLVTAGLDTVALRVPAHETALAILEATGRPVAAPSANTSGRVSATTARHVADDLGAKADLIIDSGPCPAGVESTIVGFEDGSPVLLRPGALPREDIEAVTGPLGRPASGKTVSPGMLASHYAPRAQLRLNAHDAAPGEALLAFGPGATENEATLNLSPGGNMAEAASNLFDYLRRLDATGAATIAVMPVPGHGLGEAINDRLRRAAVSRDTP